MLGDVIQRYGPTTILIVMTAFLWALADVIDTRIDDLRDMITDRFNAMDSRFGGLEQGQSELSERMTRVETKVEAIGDQLGEAAGRVAAPPEVTGRTE